MASKRKVKAKVGQTDAAKGSLPFAPDFAVIIDHNAAPGDDRALAELLLRIAQRQAVKDASTRRRPTDG